MSHQIQQKPLVSIVIGTRPEAIKMAPLVIAFSNCKKVHTRVILTGQHKEIVYPIIELFNLKIDNDLKLVNDNLDLSDLTSVLLKGLTFEFNNYLPNLVLVQGDTTSALAGAMAAFYKKIPIGHVEAGLRTNNLNDPFPEEANRRIISQLSSLHFAPTNSAEKLLNSIGLTKTYLTGNTVIDSLDYISSKSQKPIIKGLHWDSTRVILASVHRRENWGERLINILIGFQKVLNHHTDTSLLLPMHPNKIVREPIIKMLGSHPRAFLIEPLLYDQQVGAMKNCTLVITDSGGIQEEAPALGKPVLVLRDNTERPEAIDSGTAKLIGTNSENIEKEATLLLSNSKVYDSMAHAINPFGDGKASKRILEICLRILNENNNQYEK